MKNITLNLERVTQQAWGGAADVPPNHGALIKISKPLISFTTYRAKASPRWNNTLGTGRAIK